MTDAAIQGCVSRAKEMVDRLYSPEGETGKTSTTLFLVQPMRILSNKQLVGGAVLLRDDGQVAAVPAPQDLVAVGPRLQSNGIRFRMYYRNRVVLFLNAIELTEDDGTRASNQIRKWIKSHWCPVWADPDVCDDLDIDSLSLPFQANRLSSVPGPFETEIRALQPNSGMRN